MNDKPTPLASNTSPGPLWLPTAQVERMMRECKAKTTETVQIRRDELEGLLHDSLLWRQERSERSQSPSETSERSLPGLLRRLDALTDLPVGVTAIADDAIFRDAAAEIRSLERRLEAANARIQRWQMPECTDSGWEMRDGQMVCKGCNRSFSDVFNSAEAAAESPEKAKELPRKLDREDGDQRHYGDGTGLGFEES